MTSTEDRCKIRIAPLLLAAMALAAIAWAPRAGQEDVVRLVLSDGRVIDGRLVDFDDGSYTVATRRGETRLRVAEVNRIEAP